MNDSLTLDKLIIVSPRFARSVSLLRDVHRPASLDGYILTPTGRDLLRRLTDALRGESSTRAWSLTGPYGSGKSAFALFVAQLLGGDELIRQQARKFLSSADPELSERLFGSNGPLHGNARRLWSVLICGSRQPLEKALAVGLAASLRTVVRRGRLHQLAERLERLAEQEVPSGATVVSLMEETNSYLERFDKNSVGILLIVDELGKFLEYAACHPEQSDVFILQELAELATRSKRPFLLLTILHQALDLYVSHMSPRRRAEWAKVQGRFEDVAFEERTEQMLQLLAHAIRQEGEDTYLKSLQSQAKTLAQEVVALGVRFGSIAPPELQEYLTACYPIHPFTAIVLGPLFRQLAQNERSLFTFLTSSEPHGLQEFLHKTTLKGGTYRLDHLYDYVTAALGPHLFAHSRGKLWAEVQSVIDRLPNASPLEVRLVKTIGLLQAVGPAAGIPPSGSILRAALRDIATDTEIEQAIQSLSRRSAVVFRRHSASYALWEGSDIDLDERLRLAHAAVERDLNLAEFLTRLVPPRPLIASRHYFQTGTLRYFEVCYADHRTFQTNLFSGLLAANWKKADGRIVYCLPRDAEDRESMRDIVESPTEVPIIFVLPQDLFDLWELCHELVCLHWVMDHTPELESDRTARRELNARIAVAEQNLQSHLGWVFSPANKGCSWYYHGQILTLSSQRQLNDVLSQICDEVYNATPHWRNELINRRSLSSSAAAARRNLIDAIFERAEQNGLGLVGNPPERSMYETLLRASRFHRQQDGIFGFYPPDNKAEPAVKKLWQAIDGFLAETENSRKSVEALFDLLRRPPFGLKDGVLPVILAVVLVHGHSEVALYESGSFVPHPNGAVFERLCRSPEKFELQRFRIAGPRSEVFQQYAAMLTRTEGGEPDLLSVVRALVRVVRDLPDYVSKTQQISEAARRVLKALKEARQPDRLLFIDLPVACGFPPFETSGQVDSSQVGAYFVQLRSAFAELQRAYPRLLEEIGRHIMEVFGQDGPLPKARRQIEHEARLVLNIVADPKLKAFLMRATDNSIEDTTWLESIATLLAGKPPTHWDDQDRARFEVQRVTMTRSFNHYRVLAFEMARSGAAFLDGDPHMLRVSISIPNAMELERVVQIPIPLQKQADRTKQHLLQVLRREGLLDKKDVSVAILSELVRQLLSDEKISTEN
jgi:hypothetical protein